MSVHSDFLTAIVIPIVEKAVRTAYKQDCWGPGLPTSSGTQIQRRGSNPARGAQTLQGGLKPCRKAPVLCCLIFEKR